MEFQVEKHLEPFAVQSLHNGRATAGKDFLAHLDAYLGRIQLIAMASARAASG